MIAAGVMQMTRPGVAADDPASGRVGPGEYVGEVGLMTGQPQTCAMTALTQRRVLEVPGDRLQAMAAAEFGLSPRSGLWPRIYVV